MSVTTANLPTAPTARQFVLFACGFRPFFLLAGLDALINMGVWLAAFLRPSIWPAHAVPSMYWHAHEMLFGFATAAIAGFLLTAVPGWTGRKSYSGAPLISLIVLWLAGRLAMAPLGLMPPMALDAIDLAFFPALILVLAPPLVRARKFPNLPFVGILTLFFLANLCFHLGTDGMLAAGEQIGLGIAIDLVMILIVIIGGRISPAFTKSGLARHGITVQLRGSRWIEILSIASIVAVLLADLAMPLSAASGAIALVAAIAQTIRLAQWHGHRTVRDPLIWVLHLGYAWLVAGLLLKGIWQLTAAPFAEKWIHALTVGAFATMILAVMTRASLGHTGRSLIASRSIAICYGLVTAAALVRVFAPALLPNQYNQIVIVSALLWIAAFAVFLQVFTPILVTPRPDGRPE
ncbi:MAG: NnrS family protein [Rhizomicrobium sp.]